MTANASAERPHGWVHHSPDDPEIVNLREHLAANNGLRGLEILDPDEIDRAVELFYRDGFVVVADVLDSSQLQIMRDGCDRVVDEILAHDPHRSGNRGHGRYSFGAANESGQQLHNPEWQMLIDLPRLTPLVTAIFGTPKYHLRGAGGDFCLPGATTYQPLHADISDRHSDYGFEHGSFHDPRGILTIRDLPCPYVSANFLMVDFTALNGPTRQIPGTQHSREPMPTLDQEPEWMKLSTVCPAPAGAVLLRDVRAWHGGTPNLSDEVRAIPSAQFYAPWFRDPVRRALPQSAWNQLSDHGRRISRLAVADDAKGLPSTAVNLGFTPDESASAPS